MANLDETSTGYDWNTEGVYQIEKSDPVEGGAEGISNRQARQLAVRTRDLHTRLVALKTQADGIIGEIQGGQVDAGYNTLLKLQNKLQAVENAINGDDGDALIETLQEALGFINRHKGDIESLVNTYIKKTSIADNLTTDDATYVLSAKQGKAIKGLIDALTNTVTALGNSKVDKVSGKGLSTNDYTTAEKNKLAALAAMPFAHASFDYVVDSNAKLAALKGKTGITSVLIKKGTWTYNSPDGTGIVLSSDVQMVWGEPGSKIVINGLYGGGTGLFVNAFGYYKDSFSTPITETGTFCFLTIEANTIVGVFSSDNDPAVSIAGCIGVQHMLYCRAKVTATFNASSMASYPGNIGYAGLGARGYVNCSNLINCEAETFRHFQGTNPSGKSSTGIYGFGMKLRNVINCVDKTVRDQWDDVNLNVSSVNGMQNSRMSYMNGCYKVHNCIAKGYNSCYASATANSAYACADTPAGGFNSIEA